MTDEDSYSLTGKGLDAMSNHSPGDSKEEKSKKSSPPPGNLNMIKSMIKRMTEDPERIKSMMDSMGDPKMMRSRLPMMQNMMPMMQSMAPEIIKDTELLNSVVTLMDSMMPSMEARMPEIAKDAESLKMMVPMMQPMISMVDTIIKDIIGDKEMMELVTPLIGSIMPANESMLAGLVEDDDLIRSLIPLSSQLAQMLESTSSLVKTIGDYMAENPDDAGSIAPLMLPMSNLMPSLSIVLTKMTNMMLENPELGEFGTAAPTAAALPDLSDGSGMMDMMLPMIQPMMGDMLSNFILPKMDDPEFKEVLADWVEKEDKIILMKFGDSSTILKFRKKPELGMDIEEGTHPKPNLVLDTVFGEEGEKPKMVNFSMWGIIKDRYITRKIKKEGMHDMMVFMKLLMPEFEMFTDDKNALNMKMKLVL
ncbi:MAG: hypothetical protein SVJ22_05895 [Halobacteriota archaeon]|nr:hypothetical protein [Halobacteriota archaeon]